VLLLCYWTGDGAFGCGWRQGGGGYKKKSGELAK